MLWYGSYRLRYGTDVFNNKLAKRGQCPRVPIKVIKEITLRGWWHAWKNLGPSVLAVNVLDIYKVQQYFHYSYMHSTYKNLLCIIVASETKVCSHEREGVAARAMCTRHD